MALKLKMVHHHKILDVKLDGADEVAWVFQHQDLDPNYYDLMTEFPPLHENPL